MKLTTERIKELIKEEMEKLHEDSLEGPTRAKSGDTRAPVDPNDPLSGPTRAQQSTNQSGKIEDRVEKLEQVVNQLVAAIKKKNN